MSREIADHEAERAVLGAILLDFGAEEQTLPRARKVLRAEDFHDPRHAVLFATVCTIADRGEPVDVVTIRAELTLRRKLNALGGMEAVGDLAEALRSVGTTAHIEAHAAIVLRCAQSRAALEALTEAAATIRRGVNSPTDVVAGAMERLASVRSRAEAAQERTFAHHVDDALERLTAAVGGQGREIPTGLMAFDGNRFTGDVGATGGMFDGELWVIAAESSGGKTALALQLARHVAETRRAVDFFSFEMDPRRLAWRMTARDHGVQMAQIKRGQVSADEMRRLQMATDKVRHLPISVHSTCTIEEIEGQVLASKARKGEELGLVVVDYLGLIPATQGIDDRKEDHQRVARYTRALKRLAMRAGVPVLLLAQFTREGNKSGKPTKHDLKGGGSIESDADVIVILHVDEKNRKLPRREVSVSLAKNRDAALTDFTLVFDGDRQLFEPQPGASTTGFNARSYVEAPAPWDPDERDSVPFGPYSPGGDAE